jgi:hypothetical protein
MLPTHGSVTSVFHLANALRFGSQPDFASWVAAARARVAYLAAALDHEARARYLVENHLVSAAPEIIATERLLAISARADRATKLAIAAIILEQTPPPWLKVAVVGRSVHFEIIPSADLEALSWIGDDLEQLLIDAAGSDLPTQDITRLGVGRAAELVVLGALAARGEHPLHVSEISDGYGYDIESTENGRTRRLEVKGCTGSTSASFHLSRNEFEKSRVFGPEWVVVQVSFADAVLISEEVRPWHVLGIRELSSADVMEMVPPDPEEFRWETSALLTPNARRSLNKPGSHVDHRRALRR